MKRSDAPKKQPVAFGVNGQRENILDTTPSGDNTASYNEGFPPVTMILKSAGGLPPKGQDVNQILYELSNLGKWSSAGALNTFDSSYSTAIGGYPQGAVLLGDDGANIFISKVDENTNNPNTTITGWLSLAKILSIASLVGAADKLPYFNGVDTAALTDLTSLGRDLIGKGTVADVLTYLGLGTAAKRDVGTSTGQVPDMSAFNALLGVNGYFKIPMIISGVSRTLIYQYGTMACANRATTSIPFPIPFPNNCFHFSSSAYQATGGIWVSATVNGADLVHGEANAFFNGVLADAGYVQFKWFAIGF